MLGCFVFGFLLLGVLQLGLGFALGQNAKQQATAAEEATAVPGDAQFVAEKISAEHLLRTELREIHRVVAKEEGVSPRREALPVKISWSGRLMSGVGVLALLLIAYLMSNNRKKIGWHLVAWGFALQLLFALLILRTPIGEPAFAFVNSAFMKLLGFTEEGSRFIFGNLVQNNVPVGAPVGAPLEASPVVPATQTGWANTGAFFAFNVLPTIVFFSALMAILYHIGIMQRVVLVIARIMQKTMRTSGAESLSAAGNIFVGQTEAPLLVRPYINEMTQSELMTVMTGGFATIAGGVLAAYVGILKGHFPDIAGHLVAASVMSAPAALMFGKMIIPETKKPETFGKVDLSTESPYVNGIDAAARGAGDGLKLALNVGAMLLAFIAVIAMANSAVGWIGCRLGFGEGCWTIQKGLGYALAPLAWLMGVPWEDCVTVGSLLGLKTVINEFYAYLELASLLSAGAIKNGRSIVIATYALCGFANFASIAIQIGGIGSIAPNRMKDLATIGLKAMIAGSLAAFMTATVAGMVIGDADGSTGSVTAVGFPRESVHGYQENH